jgi:hypothetical protein
MKGIVYYVLLILKKYFLTSMQFSNYAHMTPLFKSVADPIPLQILSTFDIEKIHIRIQCSPLQIRQRKVD